MIKLKNTLLSAVFTLLTTSADAYPWISPYAYCAGNPVAAIDPDGRKVVFINGKIGGGAPAAGSQYWNGANSTFVQEAKHFFNDRNVSFTNRDYGYLSSASQRRKEGYEYAKSVYPNWISSMQPDESFKLVSHSMGGAFSMGIEDYIKEQGRMVDYNVMINTYQVDRINVDKSSKTFYIDYQNTNDPVLFWFDINLGYGELENSDMMIREKSSEDLYRIHRSPIDTGDFWKTIKDNMEK
jgi:predicted transcriptional regulator